MKLVKFFPLAFPLALFAHPLNVEAAAFACTTSIASLVQNGNFKTDDATRDLTAKGFELSRAQQIVQSEARRINSTKTNNSRVVLQKNWHCSNKTPDRANLAAMKKAKVPLSCYCNDDYDHKGQNLAKAQSADDKSRATALQAQRGDGTVSAAAAAKAPAAPPAPPASGLDAATHLGGPDPLGSGATAPRGSALPPPDINSNAPKAFQLQPKPAIFQLPKKPSAGLSPQSYLSNLG